MAGCERTFLTASGLHKHQLSHQSQENKYVCSLCKEMKVFKTKEVFVSAFGVLFALLAVAMIAIEVWDASKVLREKAVEKELWELYQTDQSQYASIMRSMREEEEEEEEEV